MGPQCCFGVCPEICSVDQADLELRDPPASASRVLGLKACTATTTPALMLLKTVLQVSFSLLPFYLFGCFNLTLNLISISISCKFPDRLHCTFSLDKDL